MKGNVPEITRGRCGEGQEQGAGGANGTRWPRKVVSRKQQELEERRTRAWAQRGHQRSSSGSVRNDSGALD